MASKSSFDFQVQLHKEGSVEKKRKKQTQGREETRNRSIELHKDGKR
jgi:hypothetical protein